MSASITRMPGKEWSLDVLWMAHVGKALKRGHILASVLFKLEVGSVIRILPKSSGSNLLEAEISVRKVCRLANRLSIMAEKNNDRRSMVDMMAYPRRSFETPYHRPYVNFLDTIEAAPFIS